MRAQLQTAGAPHLDYARARADDLLAGYQDPLPPEKHAELDRILDEARQYYAKKGLI